MKNLNFIEQFKVPPVETVFLLIVNATINKDGRIWSQRPCTCMTCHRHILHQMNYNSIISQYEGLVKQEFLAQK